MPNLSAGQVLAPLLDDVLRRSARSLQDAERVHDLRVACRRLRVSLWMFADLVGRRERRRLDHGLARIAHALGPVRGCDVLIESLGPGDPDRRRTKAERRSALASASHAISGRKGRRLRRRLRRLRSRLEESADFHEPIASSRIAASIDRRMSRLRRSMDAARVSDPGSVHRLRLQVKKARYCLEQAQARTPDRRAIAALARAQERLGAWNDRLQRAAAGGPAYAIGRRSLEGLLEGLGRVVAAQAPRGIDPRHCRRRLAEAR